MGLDSDASTAKQQQASAAAASPVRCTHRDPSFFEMAEYRMPQAEPIPDDLQR
ncbi:hypothetical protein ACFQDI_22545 [Prosthecobacter fluviatilis]|uniref:Uncharacterized protein n=1 Tax=Prosthecobacter fluviatilis TaxID=445931 RepID=A0ABW0KW66_9BACT